MEDRLKCLRKSTRNVRENDVEMPAGVAVFSLLYLAEMIDGSQITVGVMESVGYAGGASEGDNALVMLERRKGETLLQLLTRLDLAIDKPLTVGLFMDQVNR